ncbi:glycoside hydrolase family 3 C-terminal domain-containing protein [bacterium]|nr:glycoside hydrolase family 3 C-terminal domain-containing protein [bacterium]
MRFRDTSLSFEERATDLVSRMTLDEKISQMGHMAPAIERLGVPSYCWWSEALHGVAYLKAATVFPQAIGLAATWDQPLMLRVATVISDEGRAKYHEDLRHDDRRIFHGITFWSPNINIFRDPRWGRGMETYGEDPFLTARLGVQFVRGMQGDDPKYLKTVATPKHYAVHSGPEPERHRFNAVVGQRDFLETYLPAFRATVVEAGAFSVMGAYNSFRDQPCCANPTLLTDILRNEWGFQGYVVSDCGAIQDIYEGHAKVKTGPEAAALAVAAGCDLNCGLVFQNDLRKAVDTGLLGADQIDTAVRRLFLARMKLGMFDPDSLVPFASIPFSDNDSPEHRELALEAARKSIVLLKNEGGLLPLDRTRYRNVLVLGPQAFSLDCLLGNYYGMPSAYSTVLDGIRGKLPEGAQVTYRTGCAIAEDFPNFECVPPKALFAPGGESAGLKVEYFASADLSGQPVRTGSEELIGYERHHRPWPLIPELQNTVYSARWTGRLLAPQEGTYGLRVNSKQVYRLFIDGQPVLSSDSAEVYTVNSTSLDFAAGSTHELRLEMLAAEGNDPYLSLYWSLPVQSDVDALLKNSDLVVLCLGLSPKLEGEEMDVKVPGFLGGDRTSIDLPAPQEALLEKAAASRKPVVLVLLNGSALAVNRADKLLPAIVEAWYPGEEGGRAVADVLFGDCNPGGRLPVTFFKSTDQLPPFEDYDMQGRTYRYFKGDPLYPFGHGLSYTTFAYSGLEAPAEIKAGDTVTVSVEVKNTGSRAGDEVVQLYLTDLVASAPAPVRALVGFQRVSLAPGESCRVKLDVAPEAFGIISDNGERAYEPGEFEITAGGKQPGFKGSADAATTSTLSARLKLL